jgi:hypothetical protein
MDGMINLYCFVFEKDTKEEKEEKKKINNKFNAMRCDAM